jgi:hypothetical protein
MPETAMQEHMSNRLPPMEERRCGIKKGKLGYHEALIKIHHDHHKHVNYDDMPDCSGHIAQKASPALIVI